MFVQNGGGMIMQNTPARWGHVSAKSHLRLGRFEMRPKRRSETNDEAGRDSNPESDAGSRASPGSKVPITRCKPENEDSWRFEATE